MAELFASKDFKCKMTNDWYQGDNPNTFYSNKLEAIYFYNDHFKYWEDKRATDKYQIIPLPTSYSEIIKIIDNKN